MNARLKSKQSDQESRKREPTISIGLPVFNGENFLVAALDSILAQDFRDFELIIVDNASTDGTAEICQDYAARDDRIAYHRNKVNSGAARNFNRCLELAEAPYFKWAAHDDLLAPRYLSLCLEALQREPAAVLCHSLVNIIDGDGNLIGTYDSALVGADSDLPSERFAALTLNRHLCTEMFGLMRTELVRKSKMHGTYYGGDRAMLAELALIGKFLQINQPLFLNREHPTRFVRAVAARDWQKWHAGSNTGTMNMPTWQLYKDYRAAIRRHVHSLDEESRCQAVLRRWWLVDFNLGRIIVDGIGRFIPGVHALVRRAKLRIYGELPQVREHRQGEWSTPGVARQKVIYIGGWGRSGSSLLANILGSSPKTTSVGELRYLWDRGIVENKRCGCGEDFKDCEFWQQVLRRAGVEQSPSEARRYTELLGSGATLDQLIAMLTAGGKRYRKDRRKEINQLDGIYQAVGEIADVNIVVDASKTPPYALNLLTNKSIELYFIHLIRDPRAVAFSWARKRATREMDNELLPQYSSLKSGIYWAGFNVLGLLFRWRKRANYLQVRYEDFCEEPRGTVDQIFAHCGEYDTQITWHGNRELEVKAQHSISGNPSRFNIGRVAVKPDSVWQKDMAARERRTVTAICASLFPWFGYKIRP